MLSCYCCPVKNARNYSIKDALDVLFSMHKQSVSFFLFEILIIIGLECNLGRPVGC